MSCSCGCSPCRCVYSAEDGPPECLDPGLVREGAFASVLSEELCERRLGAWRGLKADGSPVTDPNAAIRPALFVQDGDGNVKWADASCHSPPPWKIRVANDAEASNPDNYVPSVMGKLSDGCEVQLKGSDDVSSGEWEMVWVSSLQAWTTVRKEQTPDLPGLCTTILEGFVIGPGTTEYLINVASTAHMAVGVSAKAQGYEFIITELIDDNYLRAELFTVMSAPATIVDGSILCNIGFRPCPRSQAPYADNLTACLDGSSVALELPVDVNGVPVPGFHWRNQLGKFAFHPAPVDPVTGLILPGRVLRTPASALAGEANLPAWEESSSGWAWVTPVTAFSQNAPGPQWGTFNFDTSGVPGRPAGAKIVILDVRLIAATTNSYYTARVLVNQLTAAQAAVHASFESDTTTNQLMVPVENSPIITMDVSRTAGSGNGNNTWALLIRVVGFIT